MRKKKAPRADAQPARGSANSSAQLTELDREITRRQSELRAAKAAARETRLQAGAEKADSAARERKRSTGSGSGGAQLGKLDRAITHKQAELRAARAERRQRVVSEAAGEQRPVKQPGVSEPDLDRATQLRALDDRVADKHEEIRGAKPTRRAPPTPEKSPEGSAVAASPTKAPAPARGRLVVTPVLRRRLALAAVLVAIASASGLLAGWLTDNGAEPTAVADRAAPVIADYGRVLAREVETLATTRSSELERLREAQARATQAAATKELAAAHRRAARSLQRTPAPPGLQPTNDSLVTALQQVANAYGRLAGGATNRNRNAYGAGQTAVRQAEATLQRRLTAIRAT